MQKDGMLLLHQRCKLRIEKKIANGELRRMTTKYTGDQADMQRTQEPLSNKEESDKLRMLCQMACQITGGYGRLVCHQEP